MSQNGGGAANDFIGDVDGATSLSAMARGAGLSTSAPNDHRASSSVNSQGEHGPCIFSPGGYSYGSTSTSSERRCKTLKQAKGTGRSVGKAPNQKSYNQLVDLAEKTPGAEIRIVHSNEGLVHKKADRIRMKYYDSCRKMVIAENRRRASMIPEEADGSETTPLLAANNPSINASTAADGFLEYPVHLLPSAFFQLHLPGKIEDQLGGSQSSLITILAIWNTMMGTSLLAVPWAIAHSGFATGLSIIFVMTIIAFYTAYIIIHSYGKHNSLEHPVLEFSELCSRLLGPFWEWICSLFSLLAVLGAAIVYWVLMSNFLFNSVDYFISLATGSSISNATSANSSVIEVYCPNKPNGNSIFIVNVSTFNDSSDYDYVDTGDSKPLPGKGFFTPLTAPLFLIALLPMISLKSPTFFTKFNSVGTLNVFFLLGVVFFLSGSWGINATFTDDQSPIYIPMYLSSFPSLSGMMALGLFIHNAVITIMKNNRYQENNGRDLAAGFALVSGTYMTIGILFYITFPMDKSCIEDNFLNNFHVDNKLIVTARIMLLFQLLTVFPLIMYILRCQFFMLISKNEQVGYFKIYLVNSAVIVICCLFAVLLPSIGNIIRYSGAACGAVVVFILPSLVCLASAKKEGRLTLCKILIHLCIICLGLANFAAQFVV